MNPKNKDFCKTNTKVEWNVSSSRQECSLKNIYTTYKREIMYEKIEEALGVAFADG